MQEEEILGKAYDGTLMRRLLKYLRPYKWYVAPGIVLEHCRLRHGSGAALLHQDCGGCEYCQSRPAWAADYDTGCFSVSCCSAASSSTSIRYLTQWIGQQTIFDLRMEVFSYLQHLGLRFYDRNPIGRLITRVTNDIEVLNDMFSSGIVMVFSDVFTIIGILYFMFTMDWQLALVSLSVLPLLFYGTFLFRKKAREAYREVRLQIARINAFMQEHITGMMVDQVFNREKQSYEQISIASMRFIVTRTSNRSSTMLSSIPAST